MPEPTIPGISATEDSREIADQLAKMQKYLQWLLSSLDSLNVKEITTNFTRVHSRYGETIIDGPRLLMYDRQATPQLRLKQGYDDITGDFLFRLYNMIGENVLTLSSAGEIVLSGKPLFRMYDNQSTPVKRLVMGYDEVTSDFLFELYNKSGVKTVGIDSNGDATFTGTITGGIIQTAVTGDRIVITGNSLKTYRNISGTDYLNGPAWGTGVGVLYGDLSFYDQGIETFRIENALLGTGWTLRPMNGGTLYIGYGGASTYASGSWNFNYASIMGLSTSLDGYHQHTVTIGTSTYYTSSAGDHSHTIKGGLD
ncbi:MAG TPA: hypothetical protein DCY27_10645 [Desulfobacterales bacterium]|nr:hypothetical protein [Desulfobacterales bacterium]